MQWPPSPGPGWNAMKPNGFVAAAPITSHTSMSMRSQSCASSLTSAMFTERKMFSRSFVSSAASAVETSCTLSRALRYTSAAACVDASDDLRRRLRRPVDAARIDALRREREVEVGPGLQPTAGLEHGLQDLARRARIRRRLEHDDLPLLQMGRDRAGGALDVAEIGLALGRERRRHGDDDGGAVGDDGEIGRRGNETRVDEPLQVLGGDVADVALAAIDRVDDGLLDVDEHDALSGVGKRLRMRHADVAGADDGDVRIHAAQG